MTFRERLRNEIEYKGLMVKEISAAVGISNSTFLSYIDARGVLPNVETAVKIADFLGVSVEYLVNGTDGQTKTVSETREEGLLMNNYRSLSKENKTVLLAISNTLKSI
ncbi:MAG: helix-turn-helix transcriptional regulator [Treponema sp.]|nr:helix-turn-helix transcriptional regulator [Treponema sp.]